MALGELIVGTSILNGSHLENARKNLVNHSNPQLIDQAFPHTVLFFQTYPLPLMVEW